MTNEEFVYYLHSMRIGNTDAALDASNRIAKYACELRTQLQAANERIQKLEKVREEAWCTQDGNMPNSALNEALKACEEKEPTGA